MCGKEYQEFGDDFPQPGSPKKLSHCLLLGQKGHAFVARATTKAWTWPLLPRFSRPSFPGKAPQKAWQANNNNIFYLNMVSVKANIAYRAMLKKEMLIKYEKLLKLNVVNKRWNMYNERYE